MERLKQQSYLTMAIWLVLAVVCGVAVFSGNWSLSFIAAVTLLLTFAPLVFESRTGMRLPIEFVAAIVVFIFSTIFLGEAFDFYERYWWWDVVLHTGSAMGFGMIGFVFVLILFEGDKYAAPPWAMSMLAFCVGVTVGAIWEIFEFAMDQLFGMNMQKSGLIDTMWDLIVDSIGAFVGSVSGFAYLKGWHSPLASVIGRFVRSNRRLFRLRGPNSEE